jgi:hypothetical protein
MVTKTLRMGAQFLLGAMPTQAADATVAALGGVARRVMGRSTLSLHPLVRPRSFGFEGSHCFFGYYDVTPFDSADKKLLCVRRQINRDARAAGTALEVGYFDLKALHDTFVPFGQTTTWCWQQGCRLQWLGPGQVIYNRTVGGTHGAVIQDVVTGAIVREIAAPIYSVHPSGHLAVSVNLARLQRLRPGYGYNDIPDASQGMRAPEDDGLWRIDLVSGERRLLFSLANAAGLAPQASMRDAEHYFNHLSWNASGSRVLVFHLWQAGNRRFGRAITLASDGSDVYLLTNESHVSHYCWLDERTLLLTSTHADTGTGFHVYRDREGRIAAWPRDPLPLDGHPSLSPKGNWLLCDTLPDLYRERTLFLYDIGRQRRVNIANFYTPPDLQGERRCDLHPRWSRDGALICVDASHTGVRTMMTLDASDLLSADSASA